jgi:hypothetical protein
LKIIDIYMGFLILIKFIKIVDINIRIMRLPIV